MKILFVIKAKSANSWSSTLELVAKEMDRYCDVDLYCINDCSEQEITVSDYDKIVINHSISFYLFLMKKRYFKFKSVIFVAHEGEPILGWRFAFNNSQLFKVGSWLRFSKIYNRLPYVIARKTICLSSMQCELYPKSDIIPFLGVDKRLFSPNSSVKKSSDIFFPSKIISPEKNYKQLSFLKCKYRIQHPDNTPNNEMPKLYNGAKVVVIPSVIETYGLVAIEAMMCNCVIVSSESVGILNDLAMKYSKETLESAGVYFYSDNIELTVARALFHFENKKVSTRALALKFGLDIPSATKRLVSYVGK